MRRIERKFSILLLAFTSILLLIIPLLIFFTPNQVSEFYYRELTYKHISATTTENSQNDLTSLIALFNYVKENQNVDPAYKAVDKTAYNNLVMGVSWCDQQAFTLATLLNKCRINSRLRDVQGHTALEVYIDDEWKLIDPFFGQLFYRKSDGQLATLDDVVKEQGKNLTVNKFDIILPYMEDAVENLVPSSLYVPSETRWSNGIGPEFSKAFKESNIKNIITKIADFSYDILGYNYACLFQEHYLKYAQVIDMGPEVVIDYNDLYTKNDESFKHYFNARNYQLFGQNEKAQKEYQILVSLFPDSFWAKRVDGSELIAEMQVDQTY